MTRLLAFPFRLTADGTAATVDDSTDEYIEQHLHTIIGTHLGERGLVPTYGVPDPAFGTIDEGDVQTVLDEHGPYNVTVLTVDTAPETMSVGTAVVTWEHSDSNEEPV